ncbi:MAG TPA: hypothetical protein VN324_14560 [Quisquiliibacterium sp.]|nr:hypothetical protein [Quisquiliibacterium sp.]
MSRTLLVPRRFNGPPTSGNGGYVAGLLARELLRREPGHAAVEVTLRAALPLDRALPVEPRPGGGVTLFDEGQLLAEAVGVALDLELPPAPSLDEARAAGATGRMRSAAGIANPYLHCFGCGVARGAHDGLRIAPSPVGDAEVVASDWTPHAAFADEQGRVAAEIVWTALDCPAGIAWGYRMGGGAAALLTGRITLAMVGEVRAGEPYVVAAWPLEREGRKLLAGAALFDAEGRAVAFSRQLWFAPRD